MTDSRSERLFAEHLVLRDRIRQQNEASKQRFRDTLFRLPIYFALGWAVGSLLARLANAGHEAAAWGAMLALGCLALGYLLLLGWRTRRRG